MAGMTRRFLLFFFSFLTLTSSFFGPSFAVRAASAATGGHCPATQGGTVSSSTTGRITLDNQPSVCGTAKPFPGVGAGSTVRYNAYPYVNRTTADACVNVTLTATTGEFQVAAYLGSFTATTPTLNYLGDPGKTASALTGSTQPTQSFAVNVPALATFWIMVEETVHGAGGAFSIAVANCGEIAVTGISPAFGTSAGGKPVTISGTGFVSGATATLGGAPLTAVTVGGDTTLTGTTGAHPSGAVDVVVTLPDGTSSTLAGGYKYLDQQTSSTTLTSSLNPSVAGQAVTLQATLGGSWAGVFDGNVTFYEGTTALGTSPVVSSVTGYATLSVSAFAGGSHSLTATYGGGSVYAPSTSPVLTQVVNQAATQTALTSGSNPSGLALPATFTALVTVVSPGSGTPTGRVAFTDGSTLLGNAAVAADGTATFATSALSLGNHDIVATYGGDASFATSSVDLQQVVAQDPSIVTLASSAAGPVAFGTSVTITATVSNVAGGIPTGGMTFSLNGGAVLGTATLVGGTASWTGVLAAGANSILGNYSGDATNGASTGSLVQYVEPAPPTPSTFNFGSSINPAPNGYDAVVTATVVGGGGNAGFVPTGSVSFFDEATGASETLALTNGAASYVVNPGNLGLPPVVGPHVISATYGGDTHFGPASGTYTEDMLGPVADDAGIGSDAGAGSDAGGSDAGTPPGDDAGARDAGTSPNDAGSGTFPSDDAGYSPYPTPVDVTQPQACNCGAAGAHGSAGGALLAFGAVLALVGRRRRR
jgi:MYXO-CTERM domain-containing protein